MKIKFISALISILFAILVAGLGYTQILRHKKYLVLSQNNRIRLVSIEGQRGRIYDRNSTLLVGNTPSFDVFVIPQELERSVDTLSRLAQMLGILPQEVFDAVQKNYTAPFAHILIKEDIIKEKVLMLEEARLCGVMVKVRPRREYKFKETASHALGYLGEIDRGELERLKGYGYQIKDFVGKTGVEKNYDTYLRGEQGGVQLEVDNRGFAVRSLGTKEGAQGRDLTLTIDIRLQEFIENLFFNKGGAVVVMGAATGEVFALVSKPDFDPNVFLRKERKVEVSGLLTRPDRPMFNRAISGLYPAGSVFKPIVAAAGLERKHINSGTSFSCAGRYNLGENIFECWDNKGHGPQDVRHALKNSCNVFFYQLGRAAGVDDIALFASRFGYGVPCGIDLAEEASGLVPNRLWKRLVKKEAWFEGDTVNLSIGQGYLLVTPIQVARMMAVFANGGSLVQPYVVKNIGGVDIITGRCKNTGISKGTLDVVKNGLWSVVNDETGTGRRAKAEGLSISGKTGTAQSPKGQNHAWFSGFSPSDEPKIVVTVFIEHGGKGGLEAAEIAGKIFAEAGRRGLL